MGDDQILAVSRQGESAGLDATFIDRWIEWSDSDMTSIRFAVKLAMYRTPRASSSARSDACPPMGITLPNVFACLRCQSKARQVQKP